MSAIALAMNNVYKKFRKGEHHDSLRDLIPGIIQRIFERRNDKELNANEFWVLNDVSFQVRKGEALGIIGHNGAGKSTILKHLCGIMKPTKGTMSVNGRLSALIEVGAGFHPDLTGRENIFLNGTILGMKREQIKRKFDEIVAFSGLEDFIDTPVKRYSSGMYARLGFAVAAHVDPDILVVDEVLSVGDYAFQKKCTEKMYSIMHQDCTIIFVSHNLRVVSYLCDRCILLERGKVTKEGVAQEVIRYYLEQAADEQNNRFDKEVFVSNVRVRDKNGVAMRIKSGQKAWIDIEVTAKETCSKLAVVLFLKDENYYGIFDTSTERLNGHTFSLKANEKWQCTFELSMNLAPGAFYLGAAVYRYDIQRTYDTFFPAATLYLDSDRDIRGVANLHPEIVTNGQSHYGTFSQTPP